MNLDYSQKSWHFKIFLLGNSEYRKEYKAGFLEDGIRMDFCTYWRKVIFYALIKLPVFFALVAGFLFVIGNAIFKAPVETAIGFGVVIFFLFLCGLISESVSRLINRRNERRDSPDYKPPFLLEAYRSFKEKTCKMVTIK